MRLGGPIFGDVSTPEKWTEAHRQKQYRAAYCPLNLDASDQKISDYEAAAKEADLVIAEVGAWSNPLSSDRKTADEAFSKCVRSLELAERIGAKCCVNITGSCGEVWDGPHPDNLTPRTFERIVTLTQRIIDAVNPSRTFYTLETMPWAYPDSPESYLQLIQAIDRPQFGVHLDPANLICSPQLFFENAKLIQDCFSKLGSRIKSCHAKDIALAPRMTVHLDEVRPGLGSLDYRVFLQELNRLDPDLPLMLEHLPDASEYDAAALHIRQVEASLKAGV